MLHEELTDKIIKAYYTVYNTLGYGFLEKVYENVLRIELESRGMNCQCQRPIHVYYRGLDVGVYYADIIVENLVILELKAVEQIRPEHECQLINYLKATPIEVGMLLNFGRKPEFKRRSAINSVLPKGQKELL